MLNKIIYSNQENIKKDVGDLLVEAFPEDERPPVDIFFKNLIINKEHTRLIAYYDNNTFIGFTSLVFHKDICYLFFLAVSPTLRHQGYGSQILEIIKKDYSDYTILLAFEEVDSKYDNYLERKNRKTFYFNHGFKDNGFKSNEWGVIFETAYIGKRKVSFNEYKEIFKIGFNVNPNKYLKEA
jgi:GNAT superfamily N-acetyltransferase